MSTVGKEPREGGATYPISHRLFRLVWGVVWVLLAAWTPPPLKTWRRFLLCLFGARLARSAVVYGSARIWYPPNLTMGEHACIAGGVNVYCMAPVILGDYALVSQGAYLCGGTHDIDDPDFPLLTRPITIGANAWVAAEAFVGPGVTVGEGAVLGARGVTVKNLEPWAVYAGNPCRRVRDRRRLNAQGESAA